MSRCKFRLIFLPLMLAFMAICAQHSTALDTLSIVVNKSDAMGGSFSLGAIGYDPTTDAVYTSGFSGGELRRIYLSTIPSGKDRITTIATATETQLYYRNGDMTRSVIAPIQSGIVLNPQPINLSGGGTIPAYSFAMIVDSATTGFPSASGKSGNDPDETKRVYSYNLADSANLDGRNIYTTKVTLQQMMTLSGVTATSSNTGRQGNFSTDGQSFYFVDSATNVGGVYRLPAAGGTLQKISSVTGINTEPLAISNGNTDTVLFQGTGTNVGGIDQIIVNKTTGVASAIQPYINKTVLNDFFELPAASTAIDIRSMTSDATGNIYFSTTETTRNGIYKLDTNNRLTKVLSRVERNSVFGTTNANSLRMQIRPTTFTGPLGAFPITQLLYAEQTSVNAVAGANVFKAGDFNRDNILNATDIKLLKGIDLTSNVQTRALLTTRGILMTANTTGNPSFTADDYKFDMNGNQVFDWKDLKILQPFFDFGNGDIDLNGVVDFADFQVLQNNYGATAKTWFAGDLDGNDLVDFADFQILQNSFGYQSSVLTGFTLTAFDQAQWDSFVAAVPEPSTYAALGGLAIVGLIARRRRANRQSHCTGVAA